MSDHPLGYRYGSKPPCFGHVNQKEEELKQLKLTLGDCKNCKLLTDCIREFDYWEYFNGFDDDDSLDPDDDELLTDSLFEEEDES